MGPWESPPSRHRPSDGECPGLLARITLGHVILIYPIRALRLSARQALAQCRQRAHVLLCLCSTAAHRPDLWILSHQQDQAPPGSPPRSRSIQSMAWASAAAAVAAAAAVPVPGAFGSAFSSPADEHTSVSSVATEAGGDNGAAAPVSLGVKHTLEWHVASYTVPLKKGTKTILTSISA